MTLPGSRWVRRPMVIGSLLLVALAWMQATGLVALPVPAVRASTTLAHYGLVVAFDPESRTMSGTVDVTWINATPDEQWMLPFRLYPNAAYYGDGDLAVSAARVDGEPAYIQLSLDPTVMAVDLGSALEPGGTAQVSLDFETVIPDEPDASFGILGGDESSGWRLADWYPVVAGWENGGWYLAPPTTFGDPTFPASATWEMKFTAPSAYTVIASGSETVIATGVAGMDVTRVVSGPGRDLTVTLVPVGQNVVTGDAGAVPMAVSGGSPAIVNEIAETVTAGLPVLASWLGEYPGSELDIVLAPLSGAPAVSWNGLVWIDPGRFLADGELDDAARERLRFTLFHELAHQWVPGVAGSNNNDHGFMSEGLANALAILVAREAYGVAVAAGWLEMFVAGRYVALLEDGFDGVADAPLTDGTDLGMRNALVYGKAALGFEAIRQHIGDEAFLAGLEAYVAAFRNAHSGPEDLMAAWEASSGQDLGERWRFWFEEASATPDDVARVLAGFG